MRRWPPPPSGPEPSSARCADRRLGRLRAQRTKRLGFARILGCLRAQRTKRPSRTDANLGFYSVALRAPAHWSTPGLDRVLVDLGQFVVGEVEPLRRPRRCPRADATLLAPIRVEVTRAVPEHPGQGQLGQGLAAALGDLVQRPRISGQVLVGDRLPVERLALGGPGVGRDPVEVAIGQQALGERGEGDAADAFGAQTSSRPASIQRLNIEYEGWWMVSGVPRSRRMPAALAVCSGE